MKHAAYSVADHERVQLGIHATECTPEDDRPGISVRFHVTANLNAGNGKVLKTKALDAIARSHVFLAVDLSAGGWVDSNGLGVLLSIANAARRAGGALAIEGADPDLLATLEQTGMARRFVIAEGARR